MMQGEEEKLVPDYQSKTYLKDLGDLVLRLKVERAQQMAKA